MLADGPATRSPVRTAFVAALGAGAGIALLVALRQLEQVVLLLSLATLLAIGLDLAVGWLAAHGVPRRWAVLAVLAAVGLFTAGTFAAVVPAVVSQVHQLTSHLPAYLAAVEHRRGAFGRLVGRLHLQQAVTRLLHQHGSHSAVTGLVGLGRALLSATAGTAVLVALTGYLLAGLPAHRRALLRLVPRSRRARVGVLGDEVARRVGGYVLGNLFTSLIAGLGTLVWLAVVGVPFPLALGLFVAVLDLVPVVGSSVAGAVVSLVALTVSIPVALATLGFYVAYRFLEDYLLVPRVMRRTVEVSPLVTIVALIVGATLLGLVGALLAIPAAAAVAVIMSEVALPRLDAS
ncbi:MAG: AI-2E family transporter [Mycobacteriales bacterium]